MKSPPAKFRIPLILGVKLGASGSNARVSNACSNVLLEGNLFINNSHDFDVAISEAQNVRVINNVFSNHVNDAGEEFLGVPVKAVTCCDLVFEGNKFSPLSEGKKEKIFNLTDCKNVVFDGKIIS